MDFRRLLILLFLLMPFGLMAQSQRYNIELAPDLWYNKVDGIRLGMNFTGAQEGTFQDGKHRLQAGFWLGTSIPENPVSYYFSFTEPVPWISTFGNEGNVRLQSSIRTGFSWHKISLNKRFQHDFDELRYREISLSLRQQNMFDSAYRHSLLNWESSWKTLAGLDFNSSGFTPAGRLLMHIQLNHNLNSNISNFTTASAEIKHISSFGRGFGLNLRTFFGWTSDDAAPQFKYSLAHRPPVRWLESGFSRARGTIPDTFFENGLIHVNGGMNLRGYSDYYNSPFTRVMSFNAEFQVPNPVQVILDRSILGDFAKFKSYIFYDTGAYAGDDIFWYDYPEDLSNVSSDAGIGFQFSVNIPDYLGKDRGFALRYEIPLWLSHPDGPNPAGIPPGGGEPHFKFRSLLGLGAIISF